jgi:hypothetical protein
MNHALVIPDLSTFGPSSEGPIFDDSEILRRDFKDIEIGLNLQRPNPAVESHAFADHAIHERGVALRE